MPLPTWEHNTKTPKKVLDLSTTLDCALVYSPCSATLDQYGRRDDLSRLDVMSDASFGPGGGKGHQGLIALWGGCFGCLGVEGSGICNLEHHGKRTDGIH